jgi:hypothetical protein
VQHAWYAELIVFFESGYATATSQLALVELVLGVALGICIVCVEAARWHMKRARWFAGPGFHAIAVSAALPWFLFRRTDAMRSAAAERRDVRDDDAGERSAVRRVANTGGDGRFATLLQCYMGAVVLALCVRVYIMLLVDVKSAVRVLGRGAMGVALSAAPLLLLGLVQLPADDTQSAVFAVRPRTFERSTSRRMRRAMLAMSVVASLLCGAFRVRCVASFVVAAPAFSVAAVTGNDYAAASLILDALVMVALGVVYVLLDDNEQDEDLPPASSISFRIRCVCALLCVFVSVPGGLALFEAQRFGQEYARVTSTNVAQGRAPHRD